jgi:hypothetical protein
MKKLLVTLFLLISPVLMADMKIVQKVDVGPIMGQPAHSGTTTTYIKGNKAKVEMVSGKYSLVDLDSGKIYMVDDDKKSIMVMTKDQVNQMGGMISQMGGAKMQAEVKKLGSSQTVNGFHCDDYQVNVSGFITMKSVQCLSKEVDAKEFEPFKPFMEQWGKLMEGLDPNKLPGFPVKNDGVMIFMGQEVKNNSEVVSISNDSIPDSTFTVPTNYKSMEMPKMPQMPQH